MTIKGRVHGDQRVQQCFPVTFAVRVLQDEMFGQALKVELGSVTERTFLCCVVWISYHS